MARKAVYWKASWAYFGHANKASIGESDFIHTFDNVAFVLKSIAILNGTSINNQECKDIEKIKDDPMRRLGNQIIDWINHSDETHARVIQEDFEKAITKVMDEIKKVMLILYYSNFT